MGLKREVNVGDVGVGSGAFGFAAVEEARAIVIAASSILGSIASSVGNCAAVPGAKSMLGC